MSHDRARVTFVLSLLAALAVAGSLSPGLVFAQSQARPTSVSEPPYTVEYYYKAKWGFTDEFLRLFRKNHYPLLKRQVESGRLLKVTATRPRLHATEDGRWDYRVTIVFKNVATAHDTSGEEALARQLFPDQDSYKREEQRRFEILLAHWDVPITAVALDE